MTPPTCGTRVIEAPLLKPRSATMLGEWFGWLTGRVPELVDPKMLANGKDNYCKFFYKTFTELQVLVRLSLSMRSKAVANNF